MAQLNGKQLKKLKKKRKAAAADAAMPHDTALSEQKHQAQLAGAAEAVPLRLKEQKLAERQADAANLHDMDGNMLQVHSDAKPSKKQKKQKKRKEKPAYSAVTDALAQNDDTNAQNNRDMLVNGHASDALALGSPATQKKRVRFAMKRNLLMQIGGAVPPEEIRTPPDSRPKVPLP